MKRIVSVAAAVAVAMSVFAATPAFAHGPDPAAFPMKAAEFQQKVEDRLAKKKAHLEQVITEKKVDAAKAKEMRDRYDAHAAQLRAAVAEAAKDGVVTLDEARAIRAAHGHRGHHGGKDK